MVEAVVPKGVMLDVEIPELQSREDSLGDQELAT
jgi:hypothetical protein